MTSINLSSAELAKVNELQALLAYDQDNFDEEKTNRSIFKNQKLCHKLNKRVLKFCALSCLVDLSASQPHPQDTRIATAPLRPSSGSINIAVALRCKLIEASDWAWKARRKLWPYLLYLIWFACTLHISHSLYYKYAYDYYSFKLSRMRWFNQTHDDEEFLLEQMERRGRDLRRVGAAANMERRYIVQCTYLHIMNGSLALYVVSSVYFIFTNSFDFYFVRNIFSYQLEQRQNWLFVREQVGKLALAIQQWSRTLLDSSISLKDGTLVAPNGVGLVDCATIKKSYLCKQLDVMLTIGLLRPLNQRARWVARWSLYYTAILLASFVYQFATGTTIFSLQAYLLDKPINELDANEWIVYIELFFMLLTIQLGVDLYGTALIITCCDQATLVNKLRKLISLTIELNNLRFYGRKMGAINSKSAHKLQENQMNRDILLVLMHYRIFVAQLMKLKKPLGIISASAVFVMFLMPVLSRLHVPYFQIDSMQSNRLLVVVISIAIFIPGDIYLVPVCYLNKRCIDLYCQLNSLLAHITQISLDSRQANEHDRHIIISLLRKELSHHDQIICQLTIRFLGINFTYDNLVRIHFYIGFILLTIMGENLAQIKEQTGTIFTDPLDLF